MRQALATPLAWTLPGLLRDPAAALHRTLPQQHDALPAPPNPTLLSATCTLMAQKPIAHHSASDVDTAEASAARRSLISAVLRRPLRATSCTPGAEVIHATGLVRVDESEVCPGICCGYRCCRPPGSSSQVHDTLSRERRQGVHKLALGDACFLLRRRGRPFPSVQHLLDSQVSQAVLAEGQAPRHLQVVPVVISPETRRRQKKQVLRPRLRQVCR